MSWFCLGGLIRLVVVRCLRCCLLLVMVMRLPCALLCLFGVCIGVVRFGVVLGGLAVGVWGWVYCGNCVISCGFVVLDRLFSCVYICVLKLLDLLCLVDAMVVVCVVVYWFVFDCGFGFGWCLCDFCGGG